MNLPLGYRVLTSACPCPPPPSAQHTTGLRCECSSGMVWGGGSECMRVTIRESGQWGRGGGGVCVELQTYFVHSRPLSAHRKWQTIKWMKKNKCFGVSFFSQKEKCITVTRPELVNIKVHTRALSLDMFILPEGPCLGFCELNIDTLQF